jgi:hypothetical protein
MPKSQPITAACRKGPRASRVSGTRKLSEILWIIWHDTEGGTAETIAAYFAEPVTANGDGPGGSAHLVVDVLECVRCLPNTAVPWGAPGANEQGFHIEQCGYAKWTEAQWLAHDTMLHRTAFKTAYHCDLFKLPVRFCKAADLRAGRKGITTHAEVTKAFPGPGRTHTDPGTNYPFDHVLALTRAYRKGLG